MEMQREKKGSRAMCGGNRVQTLLYEGLNMGTFGAVNAHTK
jgi:hypothetical protein